MKRITIVPPDKHIELFYVKPADITGTHFIIKGSEFHHIRHVLRRKKGDRISVVDGKGNEYDGIIEEIQYDRIIGLITKTLLKPREPLLEVTIIQGLIKGSRFKIFVEKATEIGVRRIIPAYTERSISRDLIKNVKRWENTAVSAMKQSGRSILPEIREVCSFREALGQVENCNIKLIAHPMRARKSFASDSIDMPKKRIMRSAVIAVGPEGGFTQDEVLMAEEMGFSPVHLGERRLRGETAGIVALTLLLYNEGDL